jgi:SAM-dependent methyltransferase
MSGHGRGLAWLRDWCLLTRELAVRQRNRTTRRIRQRVVGTRFERFFAPKATDPTSLRLHLGCGQVYLPGYENIDCDAQSLADRVMDFAKIGESYAPGSVSEVLMIHSLSYLRQWQAREFLGMIYRLLSPGGRLILELPDLGKCARAICESEGDSQRHIEAVRAVYAFALADELHRREYSTYAFGWSGWHLRQTLEDIGFTKVELKDPETHRRRTWRDVRVEAVK